MHKSECALDFIWGAKMNSRLIYSHLTTVNEIQETGVRVSDRGIPEPSARFHPRPCHVSK